MSDGPSNREVDKPGVNRPALTAQDKIALDDGAWRKDKKMISHTTLTDICESTRLVETPANDIEALTQCGYSEDEIISLLWLRQHSQSGGSDRAAVMRYLEFLRNLVMSGKLEA